MFKRRDGKSRDLWLHQSEFGRNEMCNGISTLRQPPAASHLLPISSSQISAHFSRHCTSELNMQWPGQLICCPVLVDCCQGAQVLKRSVLQSIPLVIAIVARCSWVVNSFSWWFEVLASYYCLQSLIYLDFIYNWYIGPIFCLCLPAYAEELRKKKRCF